MAAFSNYLENQIASWLNGTTMPAAPTTLYVALFSADPTDALTGSGSELTTLITGNANRVAVANNAWTKITATGVLDASIKNTNDIVITSSSLSSTTLNASHFGVFSNSTGGELLFHGSLANTIPIALNDAVKFAATTITLTIQ